MNEKPKQNFYLKFTTNLYTTWWLVNVIKNTGSLSDVLLGEAAAVRRLGFFAGIFLETLPQPDGFVRADGRQDGAVGTEGHVQDAAFVPWKPEEQKELDIVNMGNNLATVAFT